MRSFLRPGLVALLVAAAFAFAPLAASAQPLVVGGGKASNTNPVPFMRPGAIVSASLTRPADTTAYASGDIVCASVTAGSCVPLSFSLPAVGGGAVHSVPKIRLSKSGTGVTGAVFRVHLNTVAPTAANGDNGAWSTSGRATYVGCFDVTVDKAFTDGAAGEGLPCVNASIPVTFRPATGSVIIYGTIEARGAYTPASAEVFTVAFTDSVH